MAYVSVNQLEVAVVEQKVLYLYDKKLSATKRTQKKQ